MNSDIYYEIYMQGRNDYENGNHSNPHGDDDEKSEAWLNGWYDAQNSL